MNTWILLMPGWAIIVLGTWLLIGILYEHCSRWKLERRAFVGKTFMEVNGKSLHYVKKGKGGCTVVFQSGTGSSHAIWREIQDSLSAYAVTFAYDRSGIMLSDNVRLPPTNDGVSEELRLLLEKTGCPKPYVLVGHSMAGIYLRPFIERNKPDIAGIVFVEPAHPHQRIKASPGLLNVMRIPPRWLIGFTVDTGIYRAVFSFLPLSPEIPFGHPLHRQEKDFFYRSYRKLLEELDNDVPNFRDAERYIDFGTIPLTVIMGTSEVRFARIKDEAIKQEWRLLLDELQHDLLTLSTNSRLVKAENSGHIPQISDCALLVSEIRRIISLQKNTVRI